MISESPRPTNPERKTEDARSPRESEIPRPPRGGGSAFRLPRHRLLPAGIMALVVLFAAAMMPAPWAAPERAVERRTEQVQVRIDEAQLDNIHTITWVTPPGATAVLAELDGHAQPVNVPAGQRGRAVFQFPGVHQHTGSVTLQLADSTKTTVRF